MVEHAVVARGDVSSNLILPPKSVSGGTGLHAALKMRCPCGLRVRIPPRRPAHYKTVQRFFRNVFWKNIGCRFESYCAWAAYSLMGELLLYCLDYAAVAQLVERKPEELGVVGSTPARGTSKMYTANFLYADSKSVAERLRKCKSYPLPPLWESREVVKPGGTDLI